MPLYRRVSPGEPGADPNAAFALAEPTGSLPNARTIAAGPGISITDQGPGADLVIAGVLTSSFIVPDQAAEVLFSPTSAQFRASVPVTSRNGWLVNLEGQLLVSASLA
jgi:hypothetical protein